MRFHVQGTEAALEDLREALAYLNYSMGGKSAPTRVLEAYEKAIGALEMMPDGFPLAVDPLVSSLGYRWIAMASYIAVYTVDREHGIVYIERIFHRSRNWRALLGA